ncbi:MAG: LytTR family DNA-binding domain-containing protein, partial [Bacteroidales bacterium]|jgi:two-component system LytT family response regulator|nr:LytTR family DNA-binding domain-containing protein [Bacteroidales bacterium]
MKAFIVDDEKHIINTIQLFLKGMHEIEVVGTANSVKEAIAKIPTSEAELLFLDVELQDGMSFDILSQLNYKNYRIVFITAHEHYALKAIRFSAFDYLLKPIHPTDFKTACERLIQETTQSLEARVKTLEENLNTQGDNQKIVLRTAEKHIIVKVQEIVNLEADNIYTSIFFKDGKRIVVSKPIKHFEELLTEKGFYRSHRSHLVNITEISEYVKSDGGYLVMSNSKQIPLSTSKASELMSKLA